MKIKVIGRKYSEKESYYSWDADKQFPNYEEDEVLIWEIEAETLDNGILWLAENHPDYYMGANVVCGNGDFAMFPVPCEEYGKGNYETLAARIAYVQEEIKYISRRAERKARKR